MGKRFDPGPGVGAIVDGLRNSLGVAIMVLFDDHEKLKHLLAGRFWWSHHESRLFVPEGKCHVQAVVNDRWTFAVCALTQNPLHPDAQSLVVWAAQKMADLLPGRPAEDILHTPTDGGGGSSGPAEVGIPVDRARRPS